MWEVKDITGNEWEHYLSKGWEPFAVTSFTNTPRGTVSDTLYVRRQVESIYTPEAQKVQDAAFLRKEALGMFPTTYNQTDLDCAIETARIQAIRDVARFLRMRDIAPYITGYHMKDLENGKIPE